MKNKRFFAVILLIPLIFSDIILSSQNIPDFMVNENVCPDGSEQTTPSIAGNGAGRFVITWKDSRFGVGEDIFAQIYQNDNTPAGNNFKVNNDSAFASQYRPVVSMDPSGNFIIAWVDNREGLEWSIYAQRFLSDGTPAGSNFRVNDDTGTEDQEHPSIATDSEGNFIIVWADKRNGNWDIYGQLYLISGIAVGSNFKINDDVSDAVQYWPDCSRHADGSFIVAWADQRSGNYDIYYQRFTNAGTAIGDNIRVNDDAGIEMQFLTNTTIGADGNFIITWTDQRNFDRDIYAQQYLNDGSLLGSNFQVNDDDTNTDQQMSFLATDGAGNFTICWEDYRDTVGDIYARSYSNQGIPSGTGFKVNDDTLNAYQYYSGITSDFEGNFTIAWEDYRLGNRGDIFLQNYNDESTPLLTNEKVNDDFASENQETPSIAVSGNEEFFVAWVDYRNDESDIYAQRFDGNGNVSGANFLVNDDLGGYQQCEPSAASDDAGNTMVVWTDYRSGYPSNIYAQVYAPDGSPVSENFQVDNGGAYMHYSPVVATSPNGGFVVTWWDTNDGGGNEGNFRFPENLLNNEPTLEQSSLFSDADVWAQRFTAEGEPIGDNFRVNDIYDDFYHYYPDVAVDGEGRFVIAWCDDRDGEDAIFFQRYAADGTPVGANVKVESLPAGVFQRSPSVAVDGNGSFIISWMDKQSNNTCILAQRFSQEGIPLGNILEVSAQEENTYCYNPVVSANESGNFTICWYFHHLSNYKVLARRYENDGSPVGEIYRLSDSTNSFQIYPELSMQNNRIFAAWHDNRGLQTGFDIWANVYEWGSWVGLDKQVSPDKSHEETILEIFPNPLKDQATISFNLQQPGNAILYFTDNLGRTVKTLPLGNLMSGKYETTAEISGMPKGLVICILSVDGEVIERVKVVVDY